MALRDNNDAQFRTGRVQNGPGPKSSVCGPQPPPQKDLRERGRRIARSPPFSPGRCLQLQIATLQVTNYEGGWLRLRGWMAVAQTQVVLSRRAGSRRRGAKEREAREERMRQTRGGGAMQVCISCESALTKDTLVYSSPTATVSSPRCLHLSASVLLHLVPRGKFPYIPSNQLAFLEAGLSFLV